MQNENSIHDNEQARNFNQGNSGFGMRKELLRQYDRHHLFITVLFHSRCTYYVYMEAPFHLSSSCDNYSSSYSELQTPGEETEQSWKNEVAEIWEMNYHEAAIYLEEGENNDKFDFHPSSKSALPPYLLVHNHWFYTLDLLASIMLLGLAMVEKPAVPTFQMPEGIHGSLELLLLAVMCVELAMKLRWMGLRPFFKHKRTVIKSGVLVVMVLEAIVVLIRQSSHFRVTRALRPVFLIDNHYCGGVRRAIRQILQSLPPILDMLVLLFFFMLIFSVLGFYLFSPYPNDPYFSSLPASMVSLFVLLTTANYPDVMMPMYSVSRWSAVFFIAFLIVHLYFLMNLMLAVVYEAFTRIEKDKFRKLLLHRRRACQHAFRLLVTRRSPDHVSFQHFEGLMHFFKPNSSRRDVYLMFKTLDTNQSQTLSLEEFYPVYEVSALKWKPKRFDDFWFESISLPFRNVFTMINKMVTWKWTEFIINMVIAANGIWQLVEAADLSGTQPGHMDSYNNDQKGIFIDTTSSWISLSFVTFYTMEAVLKILGLGIHRYFQSGWNTYDFIVTVASIAGIVAAHFNIPFSCIVILRPLRLLRLFKLKRRYRDVLGTVFILLPRFLSVAMVLTVIYYFFAILGMEIFSGFNMENCCKNTTVEQYFRHSNSSFGEGYYYLNNFENILTSGVTLFELMVVNNWFILMDGYASVATDWSRIFFLLFYTVTMVVLNVTVAFVLEAFLFRIQYKRKMGDMDKDSLVKVDIGLCLEEVDFCQGKTSLISLTFLRGQMELLGPCVPYRGTRNRTKFAFSLKMYGEEVKVWVEKADEEFQLQVVSLLSDLENREVSEIVEEGTSRRTFTM